MRAADDLALALQAKTLAVSMSHLAKGLVRIEVPKPQERSLVVLRDVMDSEAFWKGICRCGCAWGKKTSPAAWSSTT